VNFFNPQKTPHKTPQLQPSKHHNFTTKNHQHPTTFPENPPKKHKKDAQNPPSTTVSKFFRKKKKKWCALGDDFRTWMGDTAPCDWVQLQS
jgi:hypothetical protein